MTMTPEEQTAHDTILAFCRSKPRGLGILCMREHKGDHFLVDVNTFSASKQFTSASWAELLSKMLADARFKMSGDKLTLA